MPYISPSQLKSGERYETSAQEPKSRVRRYDPKDIDIAKLFTAIREHKTGNPQKDKLSKIQKLLSQPIQNINTVDANDHDNTLLHVAVSEGHEDVVDLLLSQPSINTLIKNNQAKTAFNLASDLDASTYSNKQSILTKLNPAPLVQAGSSGVSVNLTPLTSASVPETYPSSGLKNSLHGNVYQLKLLMLFLKRGLSENYDFRLSTEWDAAEKFDDLVFKYTHKENGKEKVKYRFLQAKHKQDQGNKITIGDLLTTSKDGEFNLEKYFISYLKIKNNPNFKDVDNEDNLEDFTICTNINFDLSAPLVGQPLQLNEMKSGKNKGKNILLEAITGNDIFFKDGGVRYKLQYAKHNDVDKHLKAGKEVTAEIQKIEATNGITIDLDTEIDEFLGKKLIFAVDQPNEIRLSELIKREVGEEFNLIDAELVSDNFLRHMLDWFKDKQGRFLLPTDGNEYFASTREKVTKLVMIGPTSAYSKKLQGLGVSFNNNQLTEVKNFLNSGSGVNSMQILNLESSKNTRLSAVKVNQVLLDPSMYYGGKQDSYIFVPLSKLLRLKDKVLDAFKAQGTGDLLVIECKNGPSNEIPALYSSLKTIINGNFNKKIILITKNADPLANLFKNNDGQPQTKYKEIKDNIVGLSDLTPDAQTTILDKTVNFQGRETALRDLINDDQKDLMNEEVLSELINGDEVNIGKEVPKLTDMDKACYVKRTFVHEVKKEDKKTETVTRIVTSIEDKIAIIAAKPGMGKSIVLTHLAEQTKQENPSLWVIKINLIEHIQALNEEKFDDYNSIKAIDFLSRLIGLENTLEKALFKNSLSRQDKVALFFDGFDEVNPSCKEDVIRLFTALKKTHVKKLWVTTRRHTRTTLEEALKVSSYKLNILSAADQIEFLKKFFSNNLEEAILEEAINEERLTLCTQKFLDFFTSSLGENFIAVPLQLKIVTENFQKEFEAFYKNPSANEFSLDANFNLIDLYAEFIKAKFDKFSDTQTHMRASDRLSYDKFLEQRQLLALYVVLEAATIHGINTEEEIETLLPGEMGKIKTLIDQMKKGEGCAGVVDRIVDGKPNFVHLTFSEYLAAQKLVDIFKLKIQRPPLPHSLEFIFETFYVEYGEEGIQRFIDRIVTKDLPLHTAILNSNSQSMGTLLSTNQEYRNHLDTLGRTPLHLAAMRADYAACDKLLKLDAATFINMKDKVLKWTPIRYLDQHESSPIKFKLVNLLLSKGATLDDMMSLKSIMAPVLANMESEGSVEEELDEIIEIDGESEPLEAIRQKDIANIMEGDNIDLFRSLLEKYPHLNQFITVAKETLLHLATRARNSSPQIVKYLVGEQKAEVNVAEKSDDSTPLHNAVEEGNSEIVQFLVDKGADVNAIDKEGWAPLHLAVQERNIEIIKILLTSKNIDPELKDHNGKTALDLASDEQRPEIDGLLNERKQNNLKRASSSSSDENTPNKIARKNLLRCFGSRPRRHAGLCELDSEYLLEGLGELHEAEQVEILEEVATRRFAGVKQKEIAQLVQNQRETTGLQKIGKFSSGVTEVIYYSQAGIDLIFNGDVNSTANLLFFKGVGFLSEKSAGWLDTKGASLLTENIRAGKLLRSLSPVVSRAGTSALIGLDFYNQIKALQKDNHNVGAWIGVGGDGIQLGTDGITVGIEVAEVLSPVMAELELSAVANPIAMTIAVPITLLTRGYVAYETVESEEHAEHLTIWEKTTEGARAFVGFRPESYIQKMTDEVSAYERLLTKNVDYLKCNPNIKHLIFPAIEKTSEIKTCNRTRPFQKGCTTFYTPVFTEVEYKFVDFRSKELSGFKLTREKISPPSGSQLLCVPTAEEGNELPTEGAYLCRGAIALSQTNNTAGTDAEFELGIKTNKMTGFGNLTNVFRIRGDTVFCKGGSRDDRFILNTKLYKVFDDQVDPLKLVGGLDGREGSDTLILQGDQLQTSKIIVNLPAGRLRYEYINLCIKNIENVIAAVPITVIAACDTQVIVTAAGAPTFSSPNNIVIPSNSSCSYALKTHLQGNSVLRNEAELGDFIYYIKPGVGRVSVELVLPRAKSTESPRSLSFGPEPIPLGRAYPSYPSIDMEYDELTVTNATSAEFYNRLKRDVLIPAVKPDEQKASSTVPDVRLQHRFVLMQDLSDISGISLQSPSGTEDAERLQVLNIHFRGHKIRKLIRSIETISIDKTNASSDINVHYQLKSGAVLKPHVLETITPIEKSNATSDANLNCSKPDVNHDIEHLRWLPSVLNQTQAQQVLKNYLGDQGADNFNISLSESRVIRGLVFNLLVNSVATDEFKLEVTYSLTNKPSFSFSNGGELKIVGQNNYFFNTTDNDNINRIMRIYSPIAFHHNIICNLKTPKNQRVIIGNKGREVMHNDPSASTTHLNGNGGESLFVMGSDATLSRLPLNATVLYHTGNHTDTLDFRPLTARIKAEFNATSKLQIITLNDRMNLGNDILLSLGIRHAPNNITEVITVRLNNALITDWYKKKLHIILHNAPQQIIGTSPLQQMDLPEDKPPTSWYANIFYFSQPKKFDGLRLKPIPLAFNKMHEIMIVSNDDVEEKTEIIIPRKYSQAKFFQHNKTNLIWTNTLSNSSRIVEPFSIVLKNFYQEQKLATLSFKFSNRKKIALKLKMQEISAAPNFEQALHEKKENLKKESLSIIATKQLQVQEDQNGTFTSNLPTSHYSSSGSMLETETDIYSDEEIEQSNFNETNFIRRRRFIESEEFISSSGAKQPSGIIQNAFNFINRLYSNKPVKNINDAIQEKANAYYDQYDRIKEARPKRCKNKAKKHLPAQFVQLGSDDTKQPVVTVSKTKQTLVRHITANPSLSQPRKPDFFAKATKPIFCQQQVQYDAPMQRNVSAKQGLSMKSNPVKAKQLISQMHLGEQIHHKPGKYTHTQYPSKARLSDGQPHPRSYKAYQQQHHHQTHRQQANSNPGITRVTASSDIQSTLFALSYISQNFIGKKNTPIYNPKIIRIQQQLERQTQRKISGQPLGMGIRN